MNVGDLLTHRARRTPHATAVVDARPGGRSLTYRELDDRVTRLANWLRWMELAPGTPVAVLLPNSAEYVEALFGIARAGLTSVHVNTKFTQAEAGYVLDDSGAAALIVARDFLESFPALGAVGGRARTIVVDPGLGSSEYEAGLATAGTTAAWDPPGADDPFFIGYTSGTTGRPKGAVISHRSRVLSAMTCALEYGLTERDRQLIMTPMYHGGPMTFVIMSVLTGHPLFVQEGFDVERVVDAVGRWELSSFFAVPTILKRLLDAGVSASDLSSVTKVVSNAAALPTTVKESFLERWPEIGLSESYGSTEASWVTNLRPTDQARKARSCGHPLSLVELALLSPDGGPVAEGEVGELYVRSPMTFDGYLNRSEATAAAIRADGFVTVGDLARTDDENYLYIVDRKTDMIISGGVNIYPREIEDVLIRHPGVRDAAVVGMPDDEWGELVVAAVTTYDDLTADDLDSYCRSALAAYKRPRRYAFVDAVPRSVTGKILKRDLRVALDEALTSRPGGASGG